MDDQRAIETDVEFAVADAEWRHEIARFLERPVDEDELTPPLLKGEAGTDLRRAFEQRQRAFHAWRTARGLP